MLFSRGEGSRGLAGDEVASTRATSSMANLVLVLKNTEHAVGGASSTGMGYNMNV